MLPNPDNCFRSFSFIFFFMGHVTMNKASLESSRQSDWWKESGKSKQLAGNNQTIPTILEIAWSVTYRPP